MSTIKQLKRHHACHECRSKKLKCSGDRPTCDGCRRKQDHHAASGSRRPVPECTYDFAQGEEVWKYWSGSSGATTTRGRFSGKRTPSPQNDYKSRRPRTPTKPLMEQVSSYSPPMKYEGTLLSSISSPASIPYPDPSLMQFASYAPFTTPGLSYTYNPPVSMGILPHNGISMTDHVMNDSDSFFAPSFHGQYPQQPMSMISPSLEEEEYIRPTLGHAGSFPNVTLLSNGLLRWM